MNDFVKRLTVKSIGRYINTMALFSKENAGKRAYKIFCSPRKGRLSEKQRAYLKTADKWTTLSADNDNVQCYEWFGSGPKVLLAHGWESNSGRWKNLIKSLQKADFHIIALDAPAHGESGSSYFQAVKFAAFIGAAVAHFKPQSIVGHSVGGYATLYFLTHAEHQVERVVSLGAPSDLTQILDNYCKLLGYSARVRTALFAHVHKVFGQPVSYFKIHDFVSRLEIPGLVIHGKDDAVCAYKDAEMITQNWKNSTLLTSENLGHGYQDRKIFHAIRDFLKK